MWAYDGFSRIIERCTEFSPIRKECTLCNEQTETVYICYVIVRMLNIFWIGWSTEYTETGNKLTFSLQDKLFVWRGSN